MPGLILKLGPGERVMVNGVVMENGPRRTRINILTPEANVLRLRDEADPAEARRQILAGIEQLSQVFDDPDSRARLTEATEHAIAERFYQSLKTLRTLLPREERLLAVSSAATAAQ